MLFATATVNALRTVPSVWSGSAPGAGTVWLAGGVLVVVLIVLSRAVKSPGGYIAGTAVQLPVVLSGLVVPMMFILAAVFVPLWFISLRLGAKIDRERAAYDAAHPATAPNI